ncbi:DNA polymerase III subunit delta [Novimethylophilus kurashikiensis]|uniref:DNA polymerase III subunit delta n=1 Tax=Novimethylophilus kurashikiensis TaxID=1825523 RepID=A0A2R5FD58_9PROT|nr:hypothetical protein [Novimethylophilus kurashikiensis]GBG14544.1 DNA polymerase III subunit delta [Novimethylophilus kurashikiensis]
MQHFVPTWVKPLLGPRELQILDAPDVEFLCDDVDGAPLPNHQQLIQSPSAGAFMLDTFERKVIAIQTH